MLWEAEERHNERLRVLQIVLAAIALLLAWRLLDLQVLRRGHHAAQIKNLPPAQAERGLRGRIVDRRGNLLATDIFRWRVVADPQRFRRKDKTEEEQQEERLRAALCLHQLLDMPVDHILNLLQQDSSYVVIHPAVPMEIANVINGHSKDQSELTNSQALSAPSGEGSSGVTPGAMGLCHWPLTNQIWASPYLVRFYPEGKLLAHALGFVTVAGDSYYGLEEKYSDFLQGKPGSLPRWQGEELLAEDFSIYLPSEAGHDLILTIDRGIQHIVERALAEAVESSGAEGGTIIVMAPTGAILAIASYPAYNPNEYQKYNDASIFTDPAISRFYEPGSVFKIITMAIGLDTGTATPESVFDDPGKLEVGGHVFRNADRQAHGQVTATDILALSLNVGIARLGEKIGSDVFYKYLPRFGFDSKTGVDLPHEVDGLVKFPGDPNWSWSDLIANTFGQGISVTPLQMITAVAAVANDGMLMRPYVVDRLVEDGRVIQVDPMPVRQVIKPETARTLTEMLVAAVERGAPEARIEGYRVAGKTGTAQVPVKGKYHEEWTIASFAGYVPADDPAFVCLIKLDKPQTSIWGASVAAPVFREIAPQILRHLKVPPDAERQRTE